MESKPGYCTIYIVRHGQAQANADKVVAGHTNSPLTDKGQIEAESRAKDFEALKFDAAFSPDLIRAKRTAELISLNKNLAVQTTKLLRERNFGEWEGRPEAEFLRENRDLIEKLKMLSESERLDFKYSPGQETLNDAATRFFTFLREIAATYVEKNVLVVSHGSIMRSVLMRLGFGTYYELPAGCIMNTGYFVLESDGVDFFIKSTNGINKAVVEEKKFS